MPSAQIADKYGSFFHLARQHQVIFYYVGYFSQNIVAAMAEAVRLQLEVAGVPGPTRRKLFSSFVEMAQNIIHYSADALTPPTRTMASCATARSASAARTTAASCCCAPTPSSRAWARHCAPSSTPCAA